MADPILVQNPAIDDIDLDGHRARNAAPSNLPGDYVRRDELEGVVLVLLGSLALKVDGTNQMLDDLNFGAKKGVSLAAGEDATDAVNKTQMDAADAAVLVAANAHTEGLSVPASPNRLEEFTTPGIYTWTVPALVNKAWIECTSGSGGAGGGYHGLGDNSAGGDGAAGLRKVVAMIVLPGTVMAIKVGGGGKGAVKWADEGIGGPGGGGGGSASSATHIDNHITCGGGGGGGGGLGGETPGEGGAGGAAGHDGAGPGGAAGTPGAEATNAGSGGIGGGDGGLGTVTSLPSSMISEYDEAWAFPASATPAGGVGVLADDGGNGGDGYIRIRWFEA